MRNSIHVARQAIFGALLALTCLAAHAQTVRPAPLRSLEEAIETSTAAVSLPSSNTGTLSFRECPAPCTEKSLELTAQTRFVVGSQQVSFQDFKAYVASKDDQFLMVFHKPGERTVTRLMVFGQLDQ